MRRTPSPSLKESLFSTFAFRPMTIVLLFCRWLVKSSVDIYLTSNLLQFLNVFFIVIAFSAWLWIKPVHFTWNFTWNASSVTAMT